MKKRKFKCQANIKISKKTEIIGDGNCLFRALSLFLYKTQNKHGEVRSEASKYILNNWEKVQHYILDNNVSKEEYCKKISTPGTFGTAVECFALSEIYKINFNVFTSVEDLTLSQILSKKAMVLSDCLKKHTSTINLLFRGNPSSGHFDLIQKYNLEDDKQTTSCSICQKSFKNINGLKIHNTKIHLKTNINKNLDNLKSTNNMSDVTNATSEEFNEVTSNQIANTSREKLIEINNQNPSLNGEFLTKAFAELKSSTPILKIIPKGARPSISNELSFLLEKCVSKNDFHSWISLFLFPYAVLAIPANSKQNRKSSLTTLIKNNLTSWLKNKFLQTTDLLDLYIKKSVTYKKPSKKKDSNKFDENKFLSKKIKSKIADGDLRNAIRILTSDDTIAPRNEDTFIKLKKKHPISEQENVIDYSFKNNNFNFNFDISENEIKSAISSFRPGSSGGTDSLRPRHLKDLVSDEHGNHSSKLLSSIRIFVTHLFQGSVPKNICEIFYGANLCAFNKKDGGIRPIAVGICFRRLASKVVCSRIYDKLGNLFRPYQLGFGTKCGAEAAIHAVRRFLLYPHESDKVILKIDYQNAFNMVNRKTILSRVSEYLPEFLPFIAQCYDKPSLLSYGDQHIVSQRGVQQGDPLGPALFSLAIHPLISSLDTEINLWYLDDGTLAGEPKSVLDNFHKIITRSKDLGLNLNFDKCELTVLSKDHSNILSNFLSVVPNLSVIPISNFNLLGSAFSSNEIKYSINKKTEFLKSLGTKLKFIDSHISYYLLKYSFAIPRMSYLLRCSPCWKSPDSLREFDNVLQSLVQDITNCDIKLNSWLQTTLPVKLGGLGIRDTSTLSISAFLGSINDVSDLLSNILPSYILSTVDNDFNNCFVRWLSVCNLQTQPQEIPKKQKDFDFLICQARHKYITNICQASEDKARLLALQAPESNAWINALPSSSLGNLLDNKTFHISIALRLGLPVCGQHTCVCGENADIYGLHGLSCKKSAGRASRHSQINDIIKRALISAENPSVLEPLGICRSDGKRVDGMTLIPWKHGKQLLWDATCSHTLAKSYLDKTSNLVGAAARLAENKKHLKYKELEDRFIFIPFAVETFGPLGDEAKRFINEICTKIPCKQSHSFIIQRIGLAIQRGNAASVLGTIQEDLGLDEVFNV